MRRLILLFALSFPALAAPVLNPTCQIGWDYLAADQERIDGFRFVANDKAVAETAADKRQISCGELALVNGTNKLHAVAFAGAMTSLPSNTLEFRYSSLPLPSPGKARLIVTFPETAK